MLMFRFLFVFICFYSLALSDTAGVILRFENENNVLFKLNSKKKLLCSLAYIEFPKVSQINKDLNSCKNIKTQNIKNLYKTSHNATYKFFKKYKGFKIKTIEQKGAKNYQCIIKIANNNLNYDLVRKGYALVNFAQISNPNLEKQYKKALQEARKKKLGLWKKYEQDMLCLSGDNNESNQSTLRPN